MSKRGKERTSDAVHVELMTSDFEHRTFEFGSTERAPALLVPSFPLAERVREVIM